MNVSCVGSASNPYQTAPADGFNQLFQDFSGIGSAVQSGDLATAQTSLATFQSDLQNNTGKNPLSQLFANNPTLGNDLTSLQTALKSNDPAAAKTAFTNLMSDMKGAMQTQRGHGHHHHHRHVQSGQNTTTTTTTPSPVDAAPDTGSLLNVQA